MARENGSRVIVADAASPEGLEAAGLVRRERRGRHVVVRRTARGDPFFVADRGHIHHQLLRAGLTQRDAMLILTAVSAALAVIAVLLGEAR